MYAAKISTQEDRVKQLSARLDAHIKSHKQHPKTTREPVSETAPALVVRPAAPVPAPVIVPVLEHKASVYDSRFEVVKEIIAQTDSVSYQDLMSRLGVTDSTAKSTLKILIKDGRLKNIGKRGAPRYVLTDKPSLIKEETSLIKEETSLIKDNPTNKEEVAAIKEILGKRNPEYIKNSDVQAILKERFHYTMCDTKTAPQTVVYLQSRASYILNQLVKDGWAVREGKSSKTRYKIERR